MKYKSATQPKCRWCGRPIKKTTVRVEIREKLNPGSGVNYQFWRYVEGIAYTKADCAKFSNQQIVSVDYTIDMPSGERRVHSFGEWDGESYDDPHFDTGECAKAFGRAVAEVRWPSKEKV